MAVSRSDQERAQNTTGRLRCMGHQCHIAEIRISHGFSSRTAPTQRRRTKGGQLRCNMVSKASDGNVDLARFIIDNGANVTAQDKEGWTPLHKGSISTIDQWSYGSCAGFLVDHGANVTAQDMEGSTLLHKASISGHVDLARFLVEHGANMTAQAKDRLISTHSAE